MASPHPQALWLEPVLERHLGQTTAPDRLWDSIQQGQRTQVARREPAAYAVRWPWVAVAAAGLATLALLAFLPVLLRDAPREAQAIAALAHGPEDLDFRSDTVADIRDWVKARTGLDIPLPARTLDNVSVTGVCAVKGGTHAVEVAYRVGGHRAALVVSKARTASAGDVKHRFLKCESIGGTRVSSWTMHGQLYTLAYASPGNLHDECLLCHSGPQPLTLAN